MIIKRKKCIFCDDGNSFKSREHVIPQWLLKELDIFYKAGDFSETLTEITKDGELNLKNVVRQTKNYGNYVSPYVCDKCNTGWMSQLEGVTKPILLPLVKGTNSFGNLTKNEKLLISRWAIKTSCVIDSVDHSLEENRTPIAADGNKIRMMSGLFLPRGWAVFATKHIPTRDFFYVCNAKWTVFGRMTETLNINLAYYRRTVIQIGHLILVTVFLGDPNLVLQAVGFRHYPFSVNLRIEWLKKSASIGWQKAVNLPDDSSENISMYFAHTLSLRIT